ncbi:MAG: proline dehydrogenase family protein [Bdellovibrionales bacterium]|nr:proline dehydrogenase family protein [Bdellovibrionales bacterium]
MTQAHVPSSSTVSDSFQTEVVSFGKQIFQQLGKEQPGAFNKNFWSGRIMEWSMTQKDFKTNMFRLVDVLPSLRNSEAIATHVNEYLSDAAKNIHGLVEWGVNVDPKGLRAKVTALMVKQSVKQMASQFIAGETPEGSLKQIRRLRKLQLACTVDLLGEYCLSEKEAQEYLKRYMDALVVFSREIPKWKESEPLIPGHPGESSAVCISVKLSALYSQCSSLNAKRSVEILSERLFTIARYAQQHGALIYCDAEDTAHNPMIYQVFQNVFGDSEFRNFPYPGIVLQAYLKDSEARLYELLEFAKTRGAPIAVRLVKGAYWDMETVLSQQNNWESPVFSKKESSDANYEKLTRILLENQQHFLPAFGSHNVRSLSFACCYAKHLGLTPADFELQMLYGMAEPIARAFQKQGYLVRLYVPLGELLPGMGYLVRRLLENTSNESFLRHTFFDSNEIETLLAEPTFKG